jgi:Sulfatase
MTVPAARRRSLAVGRAVAAAGSMPWYPAIVVVAFILDVWLTTSFDAAELGRPLVIGVVGGLAVTGLAIVLLRDRHQGGVVAAIATVAILGGDDLRIVGLGLAAIALVAILVWRDRTAGRTLPWARLTALGNLIAVVMLGAVSAGGVGTLLSLGGSRATDTAAAPRIVAARPPDVVILLLDAHGREDLLAEGYDEDISGFLGALESRGFEVSDRSRSNYMNTRLTLSSMFNFRHVGELGLPMDELVSYDPAYDAGLRDRVNDNAVFPLLRAAGYRIGTVTPGFDGADIRSSDVFLDGGQVTELERTLITNSIVERTVEWAAPTWFADQARERIRWNLSPAAWLPAVADPSDPDRPLFLFVHVPSPHRPYVFARDGTASSSRDLSVADDLAAAPVAPDQTATRVREYAEQLAYTDRLTIEAVDELLRRLGDEAVLIVMADHGPDVHVDWHHLETTDTRERFATLFAARTPGWPDAFGDAPTPVNLFPTLLNHYLGLSLPRQPDSSFIGIPPRQFLREIGDPDDD